MRNGEEAALHADEQEARRGSTMLKRSEKPTGFDYLGNPAITEPFGVPRSAARLLADFAIMIACMDPSRSNAPVLDFGAGSGWMTEWLARMGRRVVALDIHGDLQACLQHRIDADLRVRPELIAHQQGDGHTMPFGDGVFGHVLCYDTLHHMRDYPRVFTEFARILQPGGRAIFVEPGARHSTSPETIAFLQQQKADDPTWIERDVVLEEINDIARNAGLSGLTIVPMPHPERPRRFSLSEWRAYRAGNAQPRRAFAEGLADINYNERVIFYCDRAG